MKLATLKILESGYTIRFARAEELTLLIETIIDWAQFHRYDTISLSTFSDLPWNAPFYAKLGFRMLEESELTIGFQQIRRQEMEAGLPISERVIMNCQLQSPHNAPAPE